MLVLRGSASLTGPVGQVKAYRVARGVVAAWTLLAACAVGVALAAARPRSFRKGDRVRVVARWSRFLGRRGEVRGVDPVMVMLEDESAAIRFGARELELLEGAL